MSANSDEIRAMVDKRDALLKRAEKDIREIIMGLDDALDGTGCKVSSISVDTRNFANMAVEILIEDS